MMLLVYLCCSSPASRSFLLTSSANASFITSLLRSNHSAPCGATLRHSSIRTLQRSEWAGARVLSLTALRSRTSHCDCELVNVSPCESSPLNSCSCKWPWRHGNWIYTNFWCPLSTCRLSIKALRHTVDGFFVPPVLRFQSWEFTSTEHTFCITYEAFCSVATWIGCCLRVPPATAGLASPR